MKCFTFDNGAIVPGLEVRKDEKLGEIVFLGEEGRGRRYEKVGLLRRDPATVSGGRVLEAHPAKIVVNRGEKSEKSFYVLARATMVDARILLRVNTSTGYVRNGCGGWSAITGKPEALVHGLGAFGAAGRIGNWDDDLVMMSPGDVIAVRGSRSGSWVVDFRDAVSPPVVMVRHEWEAQRANDGAGEVMMM